MQRILMVVVATIAVSTIAAQDDGDEKLPAVQDLRAGDNEHMRYFLAGPRSEAVQKQAPKAGFKLLLVMPGGDGSAEFQTFCRRIAANATDDQWLVAQLVAPQWSEDQKNQIVWPTTKSPFAGMKFSTEEFVAAVIRDVERRHPIDPAVVFTLSWSSSGPAAYAVALEPSIGVTGSFVAMSVWKPKQLPKLTVAKGHAFYLLHSPDDRIPIAMAKSARDELGKAGAKVELAEYEGGHGWHGDVYGMMRTGIAWLETNHAAPDPRRLAERSKAKGKNGKDGKGEKGEKDEKGGK